MNVTVEHYKKFIGLLDHGLVKGLGVQEPGRMCIEAAWCAALDLPHSDDPGCVGDAVRAFKILMNDQQWSSNQARAKGLLRLGIAQIGSDQIDQKAFRLRLSEKIIRHIVPIALDAAANAVPIHAEELNSAAKRCKDEGTREAALAASKTAAVYAADAAVYAADAAVYAAGKQIAGATAAVYAAAGAAVYRGDTIFSLAADLATEVLQEMKSPGCAYLYLLEEE